MRPPVRTPLVARVRRLAVVAIVAGVLAGVGLGSFAAWTSTSASPDNRVSAADLVAPTGVTGSVQADGTTVRVSWTATASTAATGYKVYRASSAAGPYTWLADVSGRTTTSYDDTSVPDGTWYYVVRSTLSTWSSPNSTDSGPVTVAALDHFEIDAIAEQNSGRSFTITIRARTATNALASGFSGTVALSTSSGTITPSTSGSFSGGVLTQTVTVTGAYSASQTITATSGSKTGTSAAFTLHDWLFYFKKTTANTGTNCVTSMRPRDAEEGYAGLDPEELFSRTGGSGSATFCTPAMTAVTTIPATAVTASLYFSNTAGNSCQISAALFKNATTSLGTVAVTIPSGRTTATPVVVSVPNSGTTLAVGDRLGLFLSWQSVKACDSTDLHWGGTLNRSRAQFPVP